MILLESFKAGTPIRTKSSNSPLFLFVVLDGFGLQSYKGQHFLRFSLVTFASLFKPTFRLILSKNYCSFCDFNRVNKFVK
jgi:hypothetical protein